MVFERENTHIARKEHKCDECKRIICPGEKYHSFVGLWEADFLDRELITFKTCGTCEDDWGKIRQLYFYNHYDAPRVFGALKEATEEAVGIGFLGGYNRRYHRWLHL